MKRQRENDESNIEPNKKLKIERTTLDTEMISDDVWRHICDELEADQLVALSTANKHLRAVATCRASEILVEKSPVNEFQFVNLLPLALQHFEANKLPIEKAVGRYAALFASSCTKQSTLMIMRSWRAAYGITNDELLYKHLVQKMWINEMKLKHQMIVNETRFYKGLRYQFFYPMALLSPNCCSARIIWTTFVAQIFRVNGVDSKNEHGSTFFMKIFESLDDDVKSRTMENLAAAYVLTEGRSTPDAHKRAVDPIWTIEARIAMILPDFSIDQLISKLDNIPQDEFEEILATIKSPMNIFKADSISTNHPKVLEYNSRSEYLAKQILKNPTADIQEYTGLSAIIWQLISTKLDRGLHEQIAERIWKADTFEEMSIYLFCLPTFNSHIMKRTLASFLEANGNNHLVSFFRKEHWQFLVHFNQYAAINIVRKRLEEDIADLVKTLPENLALFSRYKDEATKIPEFMRFLENTIKKSSILFNYSTTQRLMQIFPEHASFFHCIFWNV